MKTIDYMVVALLFGVIVLFTFFPPVGAYYNLLNTRHGMWMSFLKFAVLATFGESLALRMKTGAYNRVGFGLLPKAVVWGILGLTIKMSFVVFSTGTPAFLAYLGFKDAPAMMNSSLCFQKVWVALAISIAMNLIFAPVMMIVHRITDMHIAQWDGAFRALIQPVAVRQIFTTMDWDSMWNFVFKKTIPLFWIPAHTITFLLPENTQVLFAAFLSVILGVILSFAIRK